MNHHYFFSYPLSYQGNLLWLVLFLLFYPPIGFLLLLLNASVHKERISYSLKYRGSKFWLLFWTVLFFPIAIILGAVRGFDVVGKPHFLR